MEVVHLYMISEHEKEKIFKHYLMLESSGIVIVKNE
jgi:hypothetical protein